MKQYFKGLLTLLVIGVLTFSSFHCASPEMTSARLYIQQNQWEDALRSLNNELDVNPGNAEAWFLRGQVLNEMGRFDEMLLSFDKSLEVSGQFKDQIEAIRYNNWVAFINAGIEYYNEGAEDLENYQYAIESFEIAAQMEPDSTLAYKNMGFAYLILGDLNAAIEPFKEVLKRETDAEIAKYLGQIYFDQGYQAWNHYLQNRDDAEAKAKTDSLMELAIEALKIAMEADPEDGETVAVLSNAFIVLERTDEAMDIFRVGIETDPENKIYYYNLGVLILQDDRYEEAAEYFKKAIELDPDYTDAFYNLGVTYVNWGVKLREEAVASRDDDDKRYLEKFRQALDPLEKVRDARADDPLLWETLGRLYANLDMVRKAEEAFDRADSLRNR